MAVKPIPENYRRLNPVLIIGGAQKAIEFYAEVFGAHERSRFPGPGNTVAHAELEIGDSIFMVEDESPMMGTKAPAVGGVEGSAFSIFIYVEDVDAVMAKAKKLGASIQREAQDQFYGDRDGHFIDPFGHRWTVATHIEDVSTDEVIQRMAKLYN